MVEISRCLPSHVIRYAWPPEPLTVMFQWSCPRDTQEDDFQSLMSSICPATPANLLPQILQSWLPPWSLSSAAILLGHPSTLPGGGCVGDQIIWEKELLMATATGCKENLSGLMETLLGLCLLGPWTTTASSTTSDSWELSHFPPIASI